MKIISLANLYLDQLQDMHSCERQLIRSLQRMSKAAQHPDLVMSFEKHLEETREHLERLTQILSTLGEGTGRKVCEAASGLASEAAKLIDDTERGPVRDAGLICSAQKAEHDEIASYGCLCTFASLLDRGADLKLLEITLSEEKFADDALTMIAMNEINCYAVAKEPI
jgi:ferritin-like metal-binding protein YciE